MTSQTDKHRIIRRAFSPPAPSAIHGMDCRCSDCAPDAPSRLPRLTAGDMTKLSFMGFCGGFAAASGLDIAPVLRALLVSLGVDL